MAKLSQRRPENIEGEFYVDQTCIDCDTCRWMAPDVFQDIGDQSAVYHQPATASERLLALQALLACPTSSIGTLTPPADIRAVQQTFPLLVSENVYHCGYHAENSYGATSYLIIRPEGNVLVDSPRFTAPLVKQLETLGGVRYLYLTHRDDVADHQKFHDHFGCERILHQDDLNADTRNIEHPLKGIDPIHLAPDLMILPVPGHTKGHTVLLYRDKYLFTGDHLAWSESLHQLIAFRTACWYSWTKLLESMHKLLEFQFEWILPGHGRRFHAEHEQMQQALQKCLDWMEKVA
jgi:glyoxylase-like metal-dependent hydrolase (beta-lactamase superfamily II)/ferredoxin